jgi:hypothetical protein
MDTFISVKGSGGAAFVGLVKLKREASYESSGRISLDNGSLFILRTGECGLTFR